MLGGASSMGSSGSSSLRRAAADSMAALSNSSSIPSLVLSSIRTREALTSRASASSSSGSKA